MSAARKSFQAKIRCLLGTIAISATVGCSSWPFSQNQTPTLAETEPSNNAELVDGRPVNFANKLNAQNVERAEKNPFQQVSAPKESSNVIVSSWQKASNAISGAFTFKPKVIKAKDPISLASKPEKLSADVYLRAARLLENRNRIPDAIAQYEKALESEPENTLALTSLARLHDRQGDFNKAVELYRTVIKLDPTQPRPHNDLGLCYARQQDINRSVLSLNEAIRLDPKSALYRNNIATVLVEIDRTDEAFKHLRAVNPKPVAHYNLAFLLNRRNDVDGALSHLEQAIAADPNLQPAVQLHQQLSQRAGTGAKRYHIGDAAAIQTAPLRTANGRRYVTPDDDTPQPLPPVVELANPNLRY